MDGDSPETEDRQQKRAGRLLARALGHGVERGGGRARGLAGVAGGVCVFASCVRQTGVTRETEEE